ncbi:hypothetical protein DPMN_070682 [Dreissena polymorpha]|uniref:Uncharacterized protein n=1 Tax=Dreissena polymorpha TaxID=45954 RepID=A0A9D3Z1F3_DREPO|nr:hypothetical protein DPMN_070632 [Dreissena polymorpha]KAH3711180.1 hypothetical protein DPMN_070681 [Dreissena polymorpha]KAH3711181.1 hypothetical protein DPMN_070682 [Dreissena polymorpha]
MLLQAHQLRQVLVLALMVVIALVLMVVIALMALVMKVVIALVVLVLMMSPKIRINTMFMLNIKLVI